MNFPDPSTKHPLVLPDGQAHLKTVFLAPTIKHPRWEIGSYSYASAFNVPDNWAMHLAPYLFETSPERLILGKFCQIADGVKFITASANHCKDGFSTYPFAIFDGFDPARPSLPDGPFPSTYIGHDVWIGQGARILPGAEIGTGCIIGSGAVVGGSVPPYSIVVGNPAKVTRPRFSPDCIQRLLAVAWWDWPIEVILTEEESICGQNLNRLEEVAAAFD